MFEKLKGHFDNLSAEDREIKLSTDFGQSIDKLHSPINNEDLEDILLGEKTSDDGGIIAMTGFYYQMMVAVFYLGEVLQGNWDGMFLDHHQDIVLFNNSKQIIKFIQVKTKNVNYSEYDYKISSSWIPKLFKTIDDISLLKKYSIEFEIVSNCHYSEKNKYSLLPFYSHGNKELDENNDVIRKSSDKFLENAINSINKSLKKRKFLVSSKRRKISCSNREKAREVQKRYYFQKTLNYFKNFKMLHITHETLEAKVVREIPISLNFKNSQLSQNALNNIIAEFFHSCYNPENASIQLIADERLNNLREFIEKQLEISVVNAYHKSTEKIFYDYLAKLDKDYSNPKMKSDFIKEFRTFLDRFKIDIEESLSSSDLTMMNIINRYLKYNESINVTLEERECKEHFFDILSLLLFLKISIENDLKIEKKNRHILSVNIDRLLFFILGNNDDLREPSEVIQDFQALFPILDDSEKLRIIKNENINVIVSGIFDKENSSEYTTLKRGELNFSSIPSVDNPLLDDINNNNIKYVQTPISILYAHRNALVEINQNRTKYNDLKDMKNKIDEELKLDGIVKSVNNLSQ